MKRYSQKPIGKLMWNIKNIRIKEEKAGKVKQSKKHRVQNRDDKMVDPSSTMLIITLNVNSLNTPIKRDCQIGLKKDQTIFYLQKNPH